MAMQLEVILLSSAFKIGNKKLPRKPFVMDNHGYPHDLICEYLLYLACYRKRGLNIESTVTENARHIVEIYNRLYKNSLKDLRIYALDEESIRQTFHDMWMKLKASNLTSLIGAMEKEKETSNTVINNKFSAFCRFLWWVEHTKGYVRGLIGIHDKANDFKSYSIPLEMSKSDQANFSIPWKLPEYQEKRRPKGSIKRFDSAYSQLVQKDGNERQLALATRDLLIIRCLREAQLRVTETCNLMVSDFEGKIWLDESGNNVTVHIGKTKRKEERFAEMPKDLYDDIVNFIEMERNEILSVKQGLREGDGSVFPSSKTGKKLVRTSINTILSEYHISPHEGRKVGLTEYCIVLIQNGFSVDQAIVLAGQKAGHSSKSDGKTVKEHYLIAKQLLNKAVYENNASLKLQIMKRDEEIMELKKKLDN